MERLLGAGLIAVRETGRDALYPERTVYEVTDAGRETAPEWLDGMLTAPKNEFLEFPAALSLLTMLTPDVIAKALRRRAGSLEVAIAALEEGRLAWTAEELYAKAAEAGAEEESSTRDAPDDSRK